MKRRGPIAFALRLALIAALLGLWELAVAHFELPAYIVPPPSRIAYAFYNGISDHLYIGHAYTTIIETLLGFVLGCALAFLLGRIVAISRTIEYYVYPLIVMFQAMPKVALIPLILVWFGLGLSDRKSTRLNSSHVA